MLKTCLNLTVTALVLAFVSTVAGQAPHVAWAGYAFDGPQAQCAADSRSSLAAAGLYNIHSGKAKEVEADWTKGSNSNFSATITCGLVGTRGFIMVSAPATRAMDANTMNAFLTSYMEGDREGEIQLSADEPVRTNEWLSADWCLGCDGSPMEERYSADIQRPIRSIKVRVLSGENEQGSGAVEVLMYDPNRRLVLTEETSHQNWAEWRVGIVTYGKFELVIRDNNRNTDGNYPGNEGRVEVLIE